MAPDKSGAIVGARRYAGLTTRELAVLVTPAKAEVVGVNAHGFGSRRTAPAYRRAVPARLWRELLGSSRLCAGELTARSAAGLSVRTATTSLRAYAVRSSQLAGGGWRRRSASGANCETVGILAAAFLIQLNRARIRYFFSANPGATSSHQGGAWICSAKYMNQCRNRLGPPNLLRSL